MSQQRVLVIDDEKNMRHMLEIMLGKAGFAVDSASDGIEGLRHMDTSDFDFILCDIKMPRMGGMEVLTKIREIDPGIAPLVITAYGTEKSAVEAMKLGAFDYLCKPFDAETLLGAVDRGVKMMREAYNLMHEVGLEMARALGAKRALLCTEYPKLIERFFPKGKLKSYVFYEEV